MFEIIISGGFLGKTLGNLIVNFDKKSPIDLAIPLAKDVLPNLTTKATSFFLFLLKSLSHKKNQVYELIVLVKQ